MKNSDKILMFLLKSFFFLLKWERMVFFIWIFLILFLVILFVELLIDKILLFVNVMVLFIGFILLIVNLFWYWFMCFEVLYKLLLILNYFVFLLIDLL